jgi:hypothetical protein
MENELKEIKNDLKEIRKDLNSINVVLGKQSVDLNHHIKRTDLAERRIELLQKAMWISIGALIVIEVLLKYGK